MTMSGTAPPTTPVEVRSSYHFKSNVRGSPPTTAPTIFLPFEVLLASVGMIWFGRSLGSPDQTDWQSGGNCPRSNLRPMLIATVLLYVAFANNSAFCVGTVVSPDGEYVTNHDSVVRPAWNSGSLCDATRVLSWTKECWR